MEIIILFLIIILVISFIVFICNKEKFNTGVTFPKVPGTINNKENNWEFVPSIGYFGPVKINYILTDSKSRVPSSLTLNIRNVLQPITADNPNATFLPIDPYATSYPSYFKDQSDEYYFGFTAQSLFNMVSLKGGEVNQNIDKIVFSKITPLSSGRLFYVPGSNLNDLNTGFSNPVAVSTAVSSDSIPSNSLDIDPTKMFVFLCSNTNIMDIPISIEFYFIDSNNYGQTTAPNSSLLYPLIGPFTLSFVVPVLYRTPVSIPVDLTSQLFLENQSINLTNDTLVGTSRKSPTGELLTATDLKFATCSPGSAISLISTNCELCSGGTYNDNQFGYGSCISCQGRYYCPQGSFTPVICPKGSYCPVNSTLPIKCSFDTMKTGSLSVNECIKLTKLVGTGVIGNAEQGQSVSLSADGTVLAVGGRGDNNGAGATWIFKKNISGTWTQIGSKLLGTGAIGNAEQGVSVSLSADGTVLAIGGPRDNNDAGATWIFKNISGTWTQIIKLVGTGGSATASQGGSVSLSANGTVLAVGGSTGIGATWIFKNTSSWTQITKLVGTGGSATASQGGSVSLSADGTVLAVGGRGDNNYAGATWIFKNTSGTTWTQIGSKLIGTGGSANTEQGASVSLSTDGTVLAVGGPVDNINAGATWIFKNISGTWTQITKLVGTGVTGSTGVASQGGSVSLSANGTVLAVGGIYDNVVTGATWIFKNTSGTTWIQITKLVAGENGTYQGASLSLSADGTSLAVGGPGLGGATWILEGVYA